MRDRELILRAKDVTVSFGAKDGAVRAVNGVSLELYQGETLGIVGESGSGKSVTIKAIMRLLPPPPHCAVSGEILFGEEDVLHMDEERLRRLRGKEISMIFQNPMSAFNPVIPIGRQIAEPIEFHEEASQQERAQRVLSLLEEVGVSNPQYRINQYPHEFSGGMLQRAMIASSLVCSPRLILADEPTTGLDVTIQAQIIRLVRRLQEARHTSLIWITHDLSLLAGFADRIAVMYGGRIVEEAPVDDIYENARHPYTRGMLAAIPSLTTDPSQALYSIPGLPPNPKRLPEGCAFGERCDSCRPLCREKLPPMTRLDGRHSVACWNYL